MFLPTRSVRFDYFRVYCRKQNVKDNYSYESRFDLGPIIEKAMEIEATRRTYTYELEDAKLQHVEKLLELDNTCLWGLQFLRVRKHDRPGIVKEDGSYELMELEDDEYIGEEVSALYDSELGVIMIQRNRDSLSPPGINLFFNKAWPEDNILFAPIITPDVLEKIKNKDYRAIKIKFAGLRNSSLLRNSLLGIVNGIEKYNSINAEVYLSMGNRKKDEGLNCEEVMKTIEELAGANEVTSFEVKILEDDIGTKPYDLINDRIYDRRTFSFSREEPINYERLAKKMLELYNDRRPELIRIME